MKPLHALIGSLTFASIAASANAASLAVFSTADTYLRNSGATAENQSYGAATSILAGSHSSLNGLTNLFRFDLSALPTSGIAIDSVILTLTSTGNGSGATVTLTVFQLSLANEDWVEGTQNGTVGSGEASAKFLTNQTANWAGSAGARTAGTDYVNTSLASFTDNAGTIGTGTLGFTSTAAFATTVATAAGGNLNLWVGTPTLTGANDFFRIASRETAGTTSDPLLTVNYTLVPEPSAAVLGGLGIIALLRRRRNA